MKNNSKFVLSLHPDDNVLIALQQLVEGTKIAEGVTVRGLVPSGHKVASRVIEEGERVKRYGQIIGLATRNIAPGEHVHTQNLEMGSIGDSYEFATDTRNILLTEERSKFIGIVRPDGRVATRNYIGILTTVNCSATVARSVADYFRRDVYPEHLEAFPNVDGVVALTHSLGCAVDEQGEGLAVIRRTLAGYATHSNFASVVVIGLGCETNQIDTLLASQGLTRNFALRTINIQTAGGTSKSVAMAIDQIKEILPLANAVKRESVDVSHLVVGLQCGGSDGYSGITANPALGAAVDLLVAQGGTAILSETPEIYGAEHLLTRRAVSRDVGEKLLQHVEWWKNYCHRMNASMSNNPSSGNKAGGLTTIYEKSLGAVAKGGTSNLMDVYGYAEQVTTPGLVFMDTPGFDPISATGQVAGGANLICFTTGRGSAYGCAPTPSLKLSTNTALWNRQGEDVDLNCGSIVDGEKTVLELGREIFDLMLTTASGVRTKSELHGYGQNEFAPWQIGAIL